MRRVLFICFLSLPSILCAQQLNQDFKPLVQSAPAKFRILESKDGDLFVFGSFDAFGGVVRGRVVKIDSRGLIKQDFQKTHFDNTVDNVIELADGKLLVGGQFTKLNGNPVQGLIRLNTDGTYDNTFHVSVPGGIKGFALQSTGKIIAVTSTFSIIRLNTDGSTDETFEPIATIASFFGNLVIDASDRIYFCDYYRLHRFTATGQKDTAFNFASSEWTNVWAFLVLSDGRVLVSVTKSHIGHLLRLKNDGSIDNGFPVISFSAEITDMVQRENGKIAFVGYYNDIDGPFAGGRIAEVDIDGISFNNIARADYNGIDDIYSDSHDNLYVIGGFRSLVQKDIPYITRIKADGSVDTEFRIVVSSSVGYFAIAPWGGKVLIGGDYRYVGVGDNVSKLIRLNADGTQDLTFKPEIKTYVNNGGASITSIVIQEDGKILVGGNGLFDVSASFGRLLPDGSIDPSFKHGIGPTLSDAAGVSFIIYANSKIYVFGTFDQFDGHVSPNFAVLDKDGTWIAGNPGLVTEDGGISHVKVQPDGKLLIYGYRLLGDVASPGKMVRLNQDGSIDNSFQMLTPIVNLADYDIDSEGNIWATTFLMEKRILKFNSSGVRQPDPSFSTAFDDEVQGIAALPGGKLAIGGWFTKYNGNTLPGFVTINSATGATVDYSSTFEPGSQANRVVFHNNTLYLKGRFVENDWSEISSLRKVVYPPQVSNFKVTATPSPGKITLSWSGMLAGIENMLIEKSVNDGSNYQVSGNPPSGISTFEEIGLAEATKFYFRVTPSAQGFAATPVVASATTPVLKPVLLPATEITTSSFVANWEYPVNTDSVSIQVSADGFVTYIPGFSSKFLKTGSVKITALLDGKNYQYRIRRYKNGLSSEPVSAEVTTLVPELRATEITTDSFLAVWLYPLGTDSARLQVSRDNFVTFVAGFSNKIVKGSTLRVTGLDDGQPYQFRIVRFKNGVASATISASTMTLVKKPGSISATDITIDSFLGNWDYPAGTDSVLLQVSRDAFGTFLPGFSNRIVKSASFRVTGLEEGQSYQFRVKRYKNGSSSDAVSAIVLTLIRKPNSLSITDVTSNSFIAHWEYPVGTDSVFVQVSRDNFTSFVTGYTNRVVKAASLGVYGLEEGTTYNIRVRRFKDGQSSGFISTSVKTLISKTNYLSAADITTESFVATWDYPLGTDSVMLQLSIDNFKTFLVGFDKLIVKGARQTIVGLNEAQRYQFRIKRYTKDASTDFIYATVTTTIKGAKAFSPTEVTSTSFIANWEYVATDSVLLQVTDNNFATFTKDFDKKIVKSASAKITGLSDGKSYQYRIKRFRNGIVSDFSSPIVANLITGLSDEEPIVVSIYPNPTHDVVNVQAPTSSVISLMTVTGVSVFQGCVDVVDMSSLNPGLYLLKIEFEGKYRTFKVVKN